MKRVFEVVRAFSPTHQKGAVNLGGHFTGTPVRAAKKAASRLCRESKIRGRCALNIEIKEITTGSAGQHYVYHVVRKKLNDPAVVQHDSIKVEHKYAITAHPHDGPLIVVPPKKTKKAAAAPPKKKAAPKKTKAIHKKKTVSTKKKVVIPHQPSTDEFIVDYHEDIVPATPFVQKQQQKITIQQPVKPPQQPPLQPIKQQQKPPLQPVKQQQKPPLQPIKPPQQQKSKGFFGNLFG